MPNGITNHKPLTTNPDLHFPLCRGTEGALYTLNSKLKKDEKGNLEIHSSDAGGDTHRYSDYPRRAKLHVGELKIVRKLTKLRKFFAEAHQAKASDN